MAGGCLDVHAGLRPGSGQQLLAVRVVAVRRLPREPAVATGELDDRGFGLYGETTVWFGAKFDISVALRGDFEHKEANLLDTFYTPAIAPPTVVAAENDFNDVSPQFSAAYHLFRHHTVYGTVARGFKAGGFNPASPAGSEAYGEEHTWNYEGGIKTLWFERRMSMNATVFHLDWSDMQVNLPNPFVPGQFFISNAAGATSTGVELEMNARLAPGCEIFAGLGYADARFGDNSLSAVCRSRATASRTRRTTRLISAASTPSR